MTKITIMINYTLKELKVKYNRFYGYPPGSKVLIRDISVWLGSLAQADIE